ncbi:MAG: type II toxin-antitoxin system RelE/ParE family toxin [Hyphomicrobiaceae bacterium]
MIRSFRSRPLKRLWVKNDASGLPSSHRIKIEMILDRLDAAVLPGDMNIPGLDFDFLKGDSMGRYAVKVSANYRITFGWDDRDAIDIDYEDYH